MYAAHFGLRELPFAITPDPAYVYLSPHHQEALAHLLYGTGEDGGFVQLTGEVGTGKTTLIRTLLEQRLDNVDIALCLNPQLTVEELLAVICDELGASYSHEQHSLKSLLDALNARLLRSHAAGRRTVLIVDEAQNLSREVLEQLRLLTNLETTKHKLLRIILVGQPELRRLLARSDLRQLAQRITARYHLLPLDRRETATYISHRLQVAGGRDDLFTSGACRAVYRYAHGIPRLVNVICDRAFLGAYSQGIRQVGRRWVRQAAREALQGEIDTLSQWAIRPQFAIAAGLVLLVLLGGWLTQTDQILTEVFAPAAVARPQDVGKIAPVKSSQDWVSLLSRSNESEAQHRLLALWGVEATVDTETAFCKQAQSYGLRCLSGRGDWAMLRHYDRPAVLQLNLPDGSDRTVLLQTLATDQAVLWIADNEMSVPLAQLETLWNGDYLLLWQPQMRQKLIRSGSHGEAVRWLRQQLAVAEGQPVVEQPSPVFDAALTEQLRAFQQARGLQPDGLAGQRTLAMLNNVTAPSGTPTLDTPSAKP